MTEGALPNLVIVGAAKCGTTSLHRYLDLHPSVFMSEQKELKFFDQDGWRDNIAWYRRQFPTAAPVRGESSPTYAFNPIFGSVPARMKELVPDARLIYLVRDPIERLVAQWVQLVQVTYERRSFAEALRDYDQPTNEYAMASRYAFQIDCFREHYADERILILDQSDLLEERLATMKRVFGFLALPADFEDARFEVQHNTGEEKYWLNRSGMWLVERGVFGPLRRQARRLPARPRQALKRTLTRPVEVPSLDEGLLTELRGYFREDAERLRAYTQRAFAHWSV